MANATTHIIVGGLFGLGVALCDKSGNQKNTPNPLLSTTIGAVFGKLPDILEPALKNPHHRQFCHSITMLLSIGYGLKKMYEWKPEKNEYVFFRAMVLCAGAGYVSHLLLDSTTPRSLPILGKI